METGLQSEEIIDFCCLPAGMHLLHTYTDLEDLYPVIGAFFRAAITRAELCLWVLPAEVSRDCAMTLLHARLPGFSAWAEEGKAILCAAQGEPTPDLANIAACAAQLGCSGLRIATPTVEQLRWGLPGFAPIFLLTRPISQLNHPENLLALAADAYQVTFSLGRWVARRQSAAQQEEHTALRQVAEQAVLETQQIERERSVQAEALRQAASELNSTLDPHEVMLRVLKNISRIIPNDETNLVLVEEDQHTIVRLVNGVGDTDELAFFPLVKLHPNFQTMGETRHPLLISDTRTNPDWIRDPQKDWIGSYISAPLLHSGRVIGFISLHSLTPGYFQPVHAGLLQIFANQATMALENARLFDEAHHRALEHEALARVSARLRMVSEREAIYTIVLDEVTALLHSEGSLLILLDATSGESVSVLGTGLLASHTREHTLPGAGLTWKVIENGLPYSTNHLENNPEVARKVPFSPCAACCIPLFTGNQRGSRLAAGGAIWVGRKAPFQETELHLLNALVEMLASALNRTDLLQRTQQNARNLETVNQLGHDLSETHDLPTIYQRLGEAVSELVGDISAVLISLYDPLTRKISCAYGLDGGAEIDVSQLPPLTLAPNGEGTQSRVVATKKSLIVDHLYDKLQVKYQIGEGKETQSALYVPMLAKDEVMGIIQVQSFRLFRFGTEDIELLTLIANTAAVAIQNARLISATQTQLAHVEALHAIDEAINSSLDLQLILIVLLNQVRAQLGMDAAGVLLYHQGSQTLEYAAGEGFRSYAYKRSRVPLGAEMAGLVMRDRRKIIVSDTGQRFFLRAGNLSPEGFRFYAGIPLIAKGQAKGVLEVFHRAGYEPDPQWVSFLEALASQAAIAVGNASLFEDLKRSHFELSEAYDSTLTGWMRTLELRDDETEQHTERVMDITISLARAMGMVESEIEHIRRGALLHDIGKMGIPDEVLHKKGPFTPAEWEIMHTHPDLAFQLLSPIAYLTPALDIPYCHHEKWDGSGYPRGLKGEQIPLAARIFAIADVWDALSSDRVYRKAWPKEQIIDYLKEQSGKHFDPKIVEIFLRTILGS